MNVNNDITTTVLAYNNNVTMGDKVCLFDVTLYQTKRNQKKEASHYHSICLDLSKRIKKQRELLQQRDNNEIESTKEIASDYCEGLKRMLSDVYSHTTSNVLSSTMARQMFSKRSRFQFSHQFFSIPLKHIIQWLIDE